LSGIEGNNLASRAEQARGGSVRRSEENRRNHNETGAQKKQGYRGDEGPVDVGKKEDQGEVKVAATE